MHETGTSAPVLRSSRRRWLFRLVAALLPLIPLLLGEFVCRLYGYGGQARVLEEMGTVDGLTYIGTKPEGRRSFFLANLTPGALNKVFTMPKDSGTVRVFMLGGSAALGYPQPRHLTSSAFFQAMLSDLWPNKTVEVVNLGITAIASFPVLCVADEALQYAPDLMIVYSGNNEFYGASGVASVHQLGRSTWAMQTLRQLRRSALVHWLASQTARRGDGRTAKRNLMESMIADSQIGPDDPRRSAAERNLEDHLTRIIEHCKQKGVPVVVCTLPANERDLAPIGEEMAPPLPDEQRTRFDDLLAMGRRLVSDDPEAALRALASAAELYDHSAELHFLTGKCLTALGRHEEASRAYIRAKDLDTMPWRAPSASNDAVRRAAKHGAVLCDLERAFRSQSPGGAIGWELTDDHVHPSLQGQALIAAALLRSMSELPPPLRVDPDRLSELPPWETYAQRLGATTLDRYSVAYQLVAMFRAPFFRRNNSDALRRFESICADLESEMNVVERRAVRRWQESGWRIPITGVVGRDLLAAGLNAEANELLSIARRDVEPYSLRNLHYSWLVLQARRRLRGELSPEDLALARQIVETGEVVRKLVSPDAPQVDVHVGRACNLLGMHERAIRHLTRAVHNTEGPEKLGILGPLLDSLVQTGRREEARQLLEQLAADPDLRESCEHLLRKLEGQPESISGTGRPTRS